VIPVTRIIDRYRPIPARRRHGIPASALWSYGSMTTITMTSGVEPFLRVGAILPRHGRACPTTVRLVGEPLSQPSWPGLSRPSTSGRATIHRLLSSVTGSLRSLPAFSTPHDVDGRDRPGHDGEGGARRMDRPCLRRDKRHRRQ